MKVLGKILLESFRQAYQALVGNKLRTFLSLLGIMIGIFCIISVLSAVNSLEQSIKGGLGELGNDVIMVQTVPWNEDGEMNYWKYIKRPDPSYSDYEFIKERMNDISTASYAVYVNGRTIKYRSSSVKGAFIMGTTYEFPEVQAIEIGEGRYFTEKEYKSGANKVILGSKITEALFPNLNPIDKYVKIFGQKFQIIATTKEEGENPFNFIDYDEVIWIGFNTAKKFIKTNSNDKNAAGKNLFVKANEGYQIAEIKDELIGALRIARKLRPRDEDNFSLNELTMLNKMLDSVFGVVYIAGSLIGIFALIVGIFSVANIMFVSVQERTNIIGIKKALGAKKLIILSEFLIESIFLCVLGGIAGLVLVVSVLKLVTYLFKFEIAASPAYLIFGVVISVIVGIISGIIPAIRAANMDPVVAIRQ
jgi:putative ABC transport system permease protein